VFSQVNCVCIAGILALRFLFSILWCSHTGYHSQEELARFGYRSERKVEKFKNTTIFSWPAGIYSLNKVISEKIPQKLVILVHSFHKNPLCGLYSICFVSTFLSSDYFKNAIWGFKDVTFFFDRPNKVPIHIHSNLINFSYLSFNGHPVSMKVMH
jgi:hypothetical protein